MSIETASYISGLNAANPPNTDPVGQAAAHLRLIKSVLKTTFPNLTGPVTKTQTDLSYGIIPVGGIIFWSALQGPIPSGYTSCNGIAVPKTDGSGNITPPDLRDKFLAIAGTLRPVDTTGGAASVTPALTVDGHVLTVAELPIHSHTVSDPTHTHGITDPGHSHDNAFTNAAAAGASAQSVQPYPSAGAYGGMTQYTGVSAQYSGTGITVQNTGSGSAHSHTGSVAAVSIVPVYYSLIAIMRI
jgi:microcystin-dependent protein